MAGGTSAVERLLVAANQQLQQADRTFAYAQGYANGVREAVQAMEAGEVEADSNLVPFRQPVGNNDDETTGVS